MPGKPWTTPEQAKFLEGYLLQYWESKSDGSQSSVFWPRIFREWFAKYSEKDSMFPGCTELTTEQEGMLRPKIEGRKTVSVLPIDDASH